MTSARASQPVDTMRTLHGEALVAAWERGAQFPPTLRAMALLADGTGYDEQQAAALSVPDRDVALLALRQRSFGEVLNGFATCGACAERLEFTLSANDIVRRLGDAAQNDGVIRQGAWSVQCRFATTADIEAAAGQSDLAAAREALVMRCTSVTREDGRRATLADLPIDLLAEVDERLVAMHEAAELTVSLVCSACEATHDVVLDLAEFLWTETRHAARRLLADVHELAWAYGWAEDAILRMSDSRRAAYLTLVRS